MANTAYKPPTVDEHGDSILDMTEDFDLAATLPNQNAGPANTPHVAFAGWGMPVECCDLPILPFTIRHEQDSNIQCQEEKRYPNPELAPANHPYYFQLTQQQGAWGAWAGIDDTGDVNDLTRVQNWPSGEMAEHHRTQSLRSTLVECIGDEEPVRTAPAALLQNYALQALGEAGQAHEGINPSFPFTASDTLPTDLADWAVYHPYTVGMVRGVNSLPIPDYTPRASADRSFDSRHRPFRPNERFPAVHEADQYSNHEEKLQDSTDDRPYTCQTCESSFKNIRDLTRHEERVHGSEEDRPHACPECERRFHFPREVIRHTKAIHSTEPASAKCELCLKTFGHRTDNLTRHMKRFHPVEWARARESRCAQIESVNGSSSTAPLTPSTPSEYVGLMTPPPSRRSFGS